MVRFGLRLKSGMRSPTRSITNVLAPGRRWALLKAHQAEVLKASGALFVYFGASLAYVGLEGWGVGDCFYFAVVVATTVGYGDLLPTSPGSKVYTALFIPLALVVAAYGIGQLWGPAC